MKKNLITALKKLVTSFGGSAESNNAVDLVDEFADIATQGDGSALIVNVIDGDTVTLDKTFAEIKSAVAAGKIVYMYDHSSYVILIEMVGIIPNPKEGTYVGSIRFGVDADNFRVDGQSIEEAISKYPVLA